MKILGREPVAWVGIIVALAIAVIQALTGQGVLGAAAAGRAVDAVQAIGQIATILVPIAIGVIAARNAVTPTAAPALPTGTTVTVYQPGVTGSGSPTTL